MQKIYINGLVKVADTVRRSLAVPRSSEQEAKLRKLVADSLAQVNDILVANGATAKQLPAPSRRAYDFLASVDLDRTPTGAS
jgi:LEA14-like dessication related protein